VGDCRLYLVSAQGARALRRSAIALVPLALALRLDAQALQPEIRFDVVGPPPASLEPGVGVNGRAGNYVRTGFAIGYDARGVDHRVGERWRFDLIARVTLDPFREQDVGFSFGGGLSHRGSTTYLTALFDLEGPEMLGMVPALQVGASGGVRGGIVLRRAIRGRR
jgi:hypothetical protein